ncbi:Fanconi anemia group D2 protein-like [Physella acuta]|uniref:Fanconi anemia group D2 protein-like n=1 Tax=Physella acuta TaxID=109671 RepID=UPI0027DD9CF4|nr:Fanconi anemia group D2 protein-like [Physella acuta]
MVNTKVTSKNKRRQSFVPPSASSAKQAKRSDSSFDDQNNLLFEITSEAGLTLNNGVDANEISVSRVIFQKQMGLALKTHSGDLLQNVETFIEDFGDYIDDPKRFHKSLMPSTFSGEGKSVQNTVPDSVVRLLLGVDVIQSPLMNLLLDKLQQFTDDEDNFIFQNGQKVYIPRLLLSQFRFLDRIVDGKELSKKLLEVLSTTALDVQKEIMACIPDIVEDSEHGDVARKLRDELMSNKALICPVIDALTYLNISSDLVVEVRNSVVDILKSFSLHDLPIVINFLLQSVTSQDALEVVNEIRSSIDLVAYLTSKKEDSEKIKTSVKLTIDALKGRIQFQRVVADAWVKALDAAKDFTVIDVFVLLILHWLNNKKTVESVVRNKIRSGVITEVLLSKAFTSFTMVMRDYFPSILSVAQSLLRSPEPSVCYIGCFMYKMSFSSFDSCSKQEIVGKLVNHIGSGFAGEIESSLNILADLVRDEILAMTRFAAYLKRVLDYLDHNNLTVAQIKKLYLLLAKLAFHPSQDGSCLQDDLHIIIRKQLTSCNPKYKRMGVMGALSIIHAVSETTKDNEALPNEELKQVLQLLELVNTSGKRDPATAALFMDSLAAMISSGELPGNVVEWIAQNMTSDFEENYVVDLVEDAELKTKCLVPVDGLFGLNNEEESTIVISLIPLVEKFCEGQKIESSHSPLCLTPLFHLVTACEMRQSNENLENIDALLGCPLFMIKPDVYDKFDSLAPKEKDVVCAGLFFCINWFREVINSFAAMPQPEMKGKVIMRLNHITQLMSALERCLASHPTFQPPMAIFDMEATPVVVAAAVPTTSGAEKKKGRKPAGKKKKGKPLTDSTINTSDIDETFFPSQPAESESTGNKKDKTVDLSNFKKHFRELDFKVFTILKTGIITRAALDSEMNTKATEQLQIGVPQLCFLLEDLSSKLSHSLLTSASKRRTFFRTKGDKNVGFSLLENHSPREIVTQVVELLPSLCDHLEEACTYFQTQTSDDSVVGEDATRVLDESAKMACCYNLLLKCIISLLSWNGFCSEENKTLLVDSLMVMVRRIRVAQDASSSVSLSDALSCALRYFGNLVETSPDLDTAVTLIKLLMVLADKCQSEELNEKLVAHAKTFLCRDWRGTDGERLKGAKHTANLQVIITTYIVYSTEPLESLEELATKGLAELANMDKKGCADEFASLNRQTLPIFYKVLLCELINKLKRIPASKKSDPESVQEDKLLLWTLAVKVLHVAVSLTKVFSARSNLGAALKYGRQFLEIFLRQCMPLLDITFRRHHSDVERLLKTLQQSTRMLHHLCGHSKITKDVALTNQVPLLKKALETFVFRVKAMLALNNCQDAFWVGNLKNRNLQGEEILTQNSVANSGQASGDEEEEDEENQADDDEESDVEMTQAEEEGSKITGGSYSEIF